MKLAVEATNGRAYDLQDKTDAPLQYSLKWVSKTDKGIRWPLNPASQR